MLFRYYLRFGCGYGGHGRAQFIDLFNSNDTLVNKYLWVSLSRVCFVLSLSKIITLVNVLWKLPYNCINLKSQYFTKTVECLQNGEGVYLRLIENTNLIKGRELVCDLQPWKTQHCLVSVENVYSIK